MPVSKMKWKKYTIKTTTAAEDLVSGMLMDLGMEGARLRITYSYQKVILRQCL